MDAECTRIVVAKHRCKKIRSGKYSYRGFTIYDRGYNSGDSKVCWEGVNDLEDNWVIPGFSKRDVKNDIDYELDVLKLKVGENDN